MNGRIENAMLHSALPKKAREMAAEMKQGDPPIVASLSGGRKITITTPDLEFLEDMRMSEVSVDRLILGNLSLSLSLSVCSRNLTRVFPLSSSALLQVYARDVYGRRYFMLNLYPEQGHCFLLREAKPQEAQGGPSDSTKTMAASKTTKKTKKSKKASTRGKPSAFSFLFQKRNSDKCDPISVLFETKEISGPSVRLSTR